MHNLTHNTKFNNINCGIYTIKHGKHGKGVTKSDAKPQLVQCKRTLGIDINRQI